MREGGKSRGYSLDLEVHELDLKKTTVLTGNHGKKGRLRAATEQDQNLLVAFKKESQQEPSLDSKDRETYKEVDGEVIKTRSRI